MPLERTGGGRVADGVLTHTSSSFTTLGGCRGCAPRRCLSPDRVTNEGRRHGAPGMAKATLSLTRGFSGTLAFSAAFCLICDPRHPRHPRHISKWFENKHNSLTSKLPAKCEWVGGEQAGLCLSVSLTHIIKSGPPCLSLSHSLRVTQATKKTVNTFYHDK